MKEETNAVDNSKLESELAHFTGTENYYRSALRLLYTDGVKYLADRAKAYWLIDAIASWQPTVRPIENEFQVWELKVNDDRTAELSVRADSGEPVIVEQRIDYTDFPLKSIRLYVQRGVLFLPSEY